MEKLLVDTNIVIDLLSKRDDFFQEAQELFTLADNKMPCMKADSFVLPPALILAEVLTITAVSGRPPIMPEMKFPSPCAFSSRFVGVTLL